MTSVEAILEERGKVHGDFTDQARITQLLEMTMKAEPGWNRLSYVQLEAAHMIVHKLARIIAGNPDQPDHWDDIAGYARLVSQRLARPAAPPPPKAQEKPPEEPVEEPAGEDLAPALSLGEFHRPANQGDDPAHPSINLAQLLEEIKDPPQDLLDPSLSLVDKMRGMSPPRNRNQLDLPAITLVRKPEPAPTKSDPPGDYRPRRFRRNESP